MPAFVRAGLYLLSNSLSSSADDTEIQVFRAVVVVDPAVNHERLACSTPPAIVVLANLHLLRDIQLAQRSTRFQVLDRTTLLSLRDRSRMTQQLSIKPWDAVNAARLPAPYVPDDDVLDLRTSTH